MWSLLELGNAKAGRRSRSRLCGGYSHWDLNSYLLSDIVEQEIRGELKEHDFGKNEVYVLQ